MTRDSAEGISLAIGLAVAIATAFAPSVLAHNKFLDGYVTHEILSLLSVTMTITFASVANIHLSITRSLQSGIKNPARRSAIEKSHATPMREEINSSAWLLFWAFIIIFCAVMVKGEFHKNAYVVSAVHGIGILVTVINLLVIRDIYKTTFIMASNPLSGGGEDAD